MYGRQTIWRVERRRGDDVREGAFCSDEAMQETAGGGEGERQRVRREGTKHFEGVLGDAELLTSTGKVLARVFVKGVGALGLAVRGEAGLALGAKTALLPRDHELGDGANVVGGHREMEQLGEGGATDEGRFFDRMSADAGTHETDENREIVETLGRTEVAARFSLESRWDRGNQRLGGWGGGLRRRGNEIVLDGIVEPVNDDGLGFLFRKGDGAGVDATSRQEGQASADETHGGGMQGATNKNGFYSTVHKFFFPDLRLSTKRTRRWTVGSYFTADSFGPVRTRVRE